LSKSLSQFNGLKYDIDIDRAIIHQLAESELLSTGKLKEKIEMVLTRSINDRTYFNHLTRLVDKKILNKQDYGQRGKVSVFYSLTKETKMRIKLRLLKEIDPEAETFRKIYGFLLLSGPITGDYEYYPGSNLDELLSKLNISRKDLRIDSIDKVTDDEESCTRFRNKYEMRILPNGLYISYKPIFNRIYLIEKIRYQNDTRTNHIYDTGDGYGFRFPGISAAQFLRYFDFFKAKADKVEEAFKLLSKNGLIRPTMKFLDETIYMVADFELYYLLKSIRLILKLEYDSLDSKIFLENFKPPTNEEIERRRFTFPDEQELEKVHNMKEIYRNDFKAHIKKVKGPNEFSRIQKKLEANIEQMEIHKMDFINLVRKRSGNSLKKYAFLSDVIGALYPSLFQ